MELSEKYQEGIKLVRRYLFWGASVIDLIIRLWMANVFWRSGIQKLRNWEGTVALFTDEYQLPLLPPGVAAMFSACIELACPILLVIGLATRVAAFALLGITGIIWSAYPQFIEHYYWAILLAVLALHGPGRISLDHYIYTRFIQK